MLVLKALVLFLFIINLSNYEMKCKLVSGMLILVKSYRCVRADDIQEFFHFIYFFVFVEKHKWC